MADFDLVVTGNLVFADRIVEDGFVAVCDGRIAMTGHGAPPGARERVDARGRWVLPGVIDGQVHAASQANQEGIGRASRAAAAGGVTTMVDMPYDDPEPVWHGDLLRAKIAQVERDSHVDVALYATISERGGTSTIAGLIEAGACAFKFSTFEAAPGRFPRIEEDLLHDAFALIAPSGLACGVHNQMQELTRKNIARLTAAQDTGWDAFGRAHTPLIEQLATALIFELGALTGARAHVVHCSLGRGFELCESYRAAGHRASIETCVQYLMLNGESDMKRLGAKLKHYPPVRPQSEVDLLWTHIAAGRCSFVSSDHVSWGLERKSNPNIFKNSSGGPGLETLLPAFWTGCEERGMSPTMVVRMLCEGPARHFLLRDRKGSFDDGADADIVVAEPGRFAFDAAKSLSAVQWSSFDGRTMHIRVAATFVRGQLVFDGSRIVNQAGDGRFLRPRPNDEERAR
ncbi:MAG: dihydroorotase [Steroidobacteraceae bacterium]